MGIQNLGLKINKGGSNPSDGIVIRGGQSLGGNPYVMWSTENGTDWQEYFNIALTWRTVSKGPVGTGRNTYGEWHSTLWSRVEAVDCNPHKVAGSDRWWWSYDFGSLGVYTDQGWMEPSGTNMQKEIAPYGWGFDDRKYDAIQMQMAVRAIWHEGLEIDGSNESPRCENNSMYIYYIPDYQITGAYFDYSGMRIEYDAPGWTRLDDRWSPSDISQGGQSLIKYSPGWWDIIEEIGTIRIPIEDMTRMPVGGTSVHIKIGINSAFRDYCELQVGIEGYFTMGDQTVCNTPLLSLVSATDDRVRIRVSDSGDKDLPFDAANVMLQGEAFDTDLQQVEPGGIAEIALPPLGVDFTVAAIGFTDSAQSAVETLTVPAIRSESGIIIAPVDSGFSPVRIRLNPSESWSFSPEMEAVKFAGRPFDSVAFGYGGSSTGKVSCDILDSQTYGDLYQSREDFENLMFAGKCILRGPDGERRNVVVESVDESWDTIRTRKQMEISMREVS